MDIKNIIGLEKPLEKLIETVGNAVGVVGNHFFGFDATRIKRIGEAEAEAERKKIIAQAEGQQKAIAILDRAGKRFAIEQYNKQINLENIFVATKDELKGKTVSDEPVEKDWTMRFLDIAQGISREDMQKILAKILAGEIQKPGNFSYQTLEVIKFLSQKDLQKFLRFVAISTDIGVIKLESGGKESLKKYGLTFNDYLELSSIGLFNQSSMISYDIELPALSPLHINIGGSWFWISHENMETTKKFNFGLYTFSAPGRELRSLLVNDANNDKKEEFIREFLEEVQRKGFKIIRQEIKE